MTDVADEAGVSLKTVSRVVNGEAGVRPETAAAVNEAIAHLGFRRNYIARALRPGQRSHMLGLVIEDVSNPFYSAIFRGVEEIARSAGYLVITASSDEDPEREQALVHLFCERRVEGLLVVPAGDDHRYVLPEVRAGTGVVFVDRPPGLIEADAVLLDNVGGARSAVRHLLELGHRRIAMLGDEERIFTAGERLRGYREEMAAAGQDVDPALVHLGAHDADAAEAATREFMALADPPTAIFTANNRITVGAIRVLWRERLPDCPRRLRRPRARRVPRGAGHGGRLRRGRARPRGRQAAPAAAGRRHGPAPARRPADVAGRARVGGGAAVKPIRLDANQLHHFYRGGERIARFRGIPSEDPYAPEDWVGSTTARFGEDGRGLTVLADGGTLRDAIAAAPEPFLGAAHVESLRARAGAARQAPRRGAAAPRPLPSRPRVRPRAPRARAPARPRPG